MKHLFFRMVFSASVLVLPFSCLAQSAAPNNPGSDTNQPSLLPLIYASDVTITSPATTHAITGTFTIQNSEPTAVGGIQYEMMLLSPLPSAAVNQLVADTPVIYDRIRPTDVINLKANEQRSISFSYQAPLVPQGEYRLRIQIITTNDRKLGWNDTTLSLGGADSFFILDPQSVNVASSDPITKEKNTTWSPLYGVNVDPNQNISFSLSLKNPGSKPAQGTISISTKRLLHANEKPTSISGASISLAPSASKDITIPITTEKTPGAYIILVTLHDASGNKISGVSEYRYVVRGESASVASVRLKSLPATDDKQAVIDFVIGGSADRATSVAGNIHMSITDAKGTVGSIDKPFTAESSNPVVGTANVAILRTVCGTPTVTITLTNASKTVLDTYSVEAPMFANPSCKKPLFSYLTLPIINTAIVIIIALLLVTMYRLRTGKR
ncbi:MAG TPA: hypothetical protein VLG69_02485 [Candidatus Andersenbacteria bacterium]|nr:hypothetical protein [Candidatus Andersenbacteria bacterium]